MPLARAGELASSLASKVQSAMAMAKACGVATASSLYGLSSQGLTLVSQAASPAASALGPRLQMLNVGVAGILQGSSDAIDGAASSVKAKVAIAALGGVPLPAGLAVVSVPVVLSTVGFTGAGITASSLAAKMMSVTAIANGGGVPAGSLVATLQSVGAAGLSMPSNVILGSIGSAASLLIDRAMGPNGSPFSAENETMGAEPVPPDGLDLVNNQS
ncbi:interferon alpha-inducible protein 27-like protein 2 isoform 4-T6 [Erethizon dorsatum]